MDRFFLPPEKWSADAQTLALEGEEAAHCGRVMRKKPGDVVEVFDGESRVGEAEILAVSKQRVELRLQSQVDVAAPIFLTLAVGIPKGKLMENVIQKAVELGVTNIVPLITAQGTVRLDERDGVKKQERWQRTALEACKQCGQNILPEVATPLALGDWLATAPTGSLLVGALVEKRVPLLSCLSEIGKKGAETTVIVGPEGDFSAKEYQALFEAGALPVDLGPLVLRVETAAVKMISAVTLYREARRADPISTRVRESETN